MPARARKRAAAAQEPASEPGEMAGSLTTGEPSASARSSGVRRGKRGRKGPGTQSPRRGRSASQPSADLSTGPPPLASPPDVTPMSPAPLQAAVPAPAGPEGQPQPRRRGRPPGRSRTRGQGRTFNRELASLAREASAPSSRPQSQQASPDMGPASAEDEDSSPDKKLARRLQQASAMHPRMTRQARLSKANLQSGKQPATSPAATKKYVSGLDDHQEATESPEQPGMNGEAAVEAAEASASTSPSSDVEDPASANAESSDDEHLSSPEQGGAELGEEAEGDESDQDAAREADILQRAGEIRRMKAAANRPGWQEPKRPKGHWEHLLEEMQWMAKEFAKERRWKLAQAKRVSRAVTRSNLDVDSRNKRKQKEELAKLQRHAAWIGKEVMGFWKKAERVVYYKHQAVLDARKREAYDKQLDFLVDQTQRYSSLLAQRLTNREAGRASTPSHPLLPAARNDTSIRVGGAPSGPAASADPLLLHSPSKPGPSSSPLNSQQTPIAQHALNDQYAGKGPQHAAEPQLPTAVGAEPGAPSASTLLPGHGPVEEVPESMDCVDADAEKLPARDDGGDESVEDMHEDGSEDDARMASALHEEDDDDEATLAAEEVGPV